MTRLLLLGLLAAFVTLAPVASAQPLGSSLTATTQEVRLLPPTPTEDERFGISSAIGGEWAVVDGRAGSVYVFGRSGTGWVFDAKIDAPGVVNEFGRDLEVAGDRIAISSIGEDGNQGAVYVYGRAGEAWVLEATLKASDASSTISFGADLDMEDEQMAIGSASGKAYVFTRSGSTWTEEAIVTLATPQPSARFGETVAISGDDLLVGARNQEVEGNALQGAAYIYGRSLSGWSQRATLNASEDAPNALLGTSVSLDGNRAVVAGLRSAYVFSRPDIFRGGSLWQEDQKLSSDSSPFLDAEISGDGLLIASPGARGPLGDGSQGFGAGEVFVFRYDGSDWVEVQRLNATAADAGQVAFGTSIGLDGDRIIVGAPKYGAGGVEDAGIAYIFSNVFATSAENESPLAAALSLPAPNPASTAAGLTLSLDQPGTVRATLHDALGRTVRTVYDGPAAGTLDLRVDLRGLAAGAYTLRVSDGGSVAARRLTVVR